MTNQGNIQPIFILPEGTQRNTGRNAQRTNIMAAKLVAETVRTTLGPKGMDKMIVDSLGDVIVTNDGVTILEEMHVEHPAAKMIVEVAKTQEDEVGDGTTTAVVISGELLKKAEELLEENIHPTVIVKGFRLAEQHVIRVLNEIAENVDETKLQVLKDIAMTAMTGKGAETSKEKLSSMVVEAVIGVLDKVNGKIQIDPDNIKIEKKVGGSVDDTELVKGIIIDKERVHPGMPKIVKNARIALIDSAVEIKDTEIDAKITITDPAQMQAFLDQEEKMLKDMVEKIAKSNANTVFCQKGIDDMAMHFLAKKGIFACRRVAKSDLEKLARATNGKIISNFDDLTETDLGFAGIVEEIKVGDEQMTYIKDCKNPKAVTIFLRGGTEHVVAEIKRAIEDSIGDIIATLKNGKVVAGGGAAEIEAARHLRKFSESLIGREQLAVQAFSEAIEVVPRTLAENAGLDPIDVLTELKSAHDKNQKWAGINVFTGKVMDSWKEGVIEPLKVKTQAISSATEVATMILRIDDVIAGGKKDSNPPGGQMPYPGGMPEM